jgi:short-subunit dehydrogenase
MSEVIFTPEAGAGTPAVVITGATEGIGRALAEEFARDGHTLVLVARDEAALARVSAELSRKYGVQVRVTSQDLSTPQGCAGVEQALRRFGVHADILVNNAGIMSSGFFQDEDPATIKRLIDLDVRAVVDLTLRFLPGMLARRRGGVLNIASMMGYMPVPYQATYAASKAFVLSFSKALSYETMGIGVRVAVAAPGVVSTGLHAKAGGLNSRYLRLIPARTAEQVAQTVYRRFNRGWSVILPGIFNQLGALAVRLVPDYLVVPLMGWFFRVRDDQLRVLGPGEAAASKTESKRAPEPAKLETTE